MSEASLDWTVNIGIAVAFIAFSFLIGKYIEKRHYASIKDREAKLSGLITTTSKYAPEMETAPRLAIVSGSVVVSSNAFLNFLFSLQSIFGGRASAYESLMDRARREAMLRMKEKAAAAGAPMVVNVWLESSRIGQDGGNGMCEVLAYGTAVIPNA